MINQFTPTGQVSYSYINELLTSRCGPDLLMSGVYPNAKEVTESFGAYSAARRYLKRDFSLNDDSVTCICVGDGCTPRTAAVFAYRSRWMCYSVDPALKMFRIVGNNRKAADRILCVPKLVEDFSITCDKALIVAVHSHAKLSDAVKAVKANRLAVIAIPCCVEQYLWGIDPDIEYNDPSIWSQKNRVKIWRKVTCPN